MWKSVRGGSLDPSFQGSSKTLLVTKSCFFFPLELHEQQNLSVIKNTSNLSDPCWASKTQSCRNTMYYCSPYSQLTVRQIATYIWVVMMCLFVTQSRHTQTHTKNRRSPVTTHQTSACTIFCRLQECWSDKGSTLDSWRKFRCGPITCL